MYKPILCPLPVKNTLRTVQTVQPGDVILAHLGGLAKFNIGVGKSYDRGLIVPGEGIPEFIQSAEVELFLVCVQSRSFVITTL